MNPLDTIKAVGAIFKETEFGLGEVIAVKNPAGEITNFVIADESGVVRNDSVFFEKHQDGIKKQVAELTTLK